LAKAAVVASAKAVPRTNAAQSAIFWIVRIAFSFLIGLPVPRAGQAKWPIATLEQIAKFVDYSRASG